MTTPGRIPGPVLGRLRCPTCQATVEEAADAVVCAGGHRLPWRHGWLDARVGPATDDETARTFESFGYEWTTFDQVHPEDERFWQDYFSDVPLDELAGRVALDAGCGKARFTRLTAPLVGSMVALDGSAAVEAAVRNLEGLDQTMVVRADLRRAPFTPESFGFISSLGVLHHLPEPEDGFRSLVELLAPGGLLLLYLYSRPTGRGVRQAGLAAASALRRVTRHMPHRALRTAAAPVALGLYTLVVVPGRIGERLGVEALDRLPLQNYRGHPMRTLWLDTFDRLSAPVEHRYVWEELEPWFFRAGLEVLAAREGAGWFIVARRPSESLGSGAAAQRAGEPTSSE